ncbi:Uncharacterised protein [Mycolicibacterium vanbaalenii]|uniref:Secreted protein n=1 Tax=Mycolicibacterium vanbaalenii TaxID=110539 RepID=A0A5S9R0A0_MYCVN|nr:hypothetical protein [Mycolicibacterium vanbaalenii]CAA0124747.1 Uncharacterised protein [Mycolicibacterium vanbaalenii]
MIGRVVAGASAALVVLGACPSAPLAVAAEGDRTIRVQDGQIRCLFSSEAYGEGGRPMAICGRTDGTPFAVSQAPLNLAAVRGSGEFFFMAGTIPGPASEDVVLGAGQTYHSNGWTVTTQDLRTLITYDVGGHGMRVNPVQAGAIWGVTPPGDT